MGKNKEKRSDVCSIEAFVDLVGPPRVELGTNGL